MKKSTLILVLAAACGGQSTGTLSIKLMDAPATFKAAVVTITEVDLVGSGGVTVLSSATTTTDLLKLSNETIDLISGATVQAGTYTELRFKISGGYVEVPNATGGGTTIYASSPTYSGLPAGATVGGTLQMPSLAQSGLKVDLPGGNVDVSTQSKVLLVDFDVQQSFGHDTGSGQWVMHPVMTATDFELSGNLNVNVALATGVTLPAGVTLAQFSAALTLPSGSVKTLALSATGAVTFNFLVPGSSYSLAFQGPTGVTFSVSPSVPFAVTINSGAATTANFTLTSP